jgi:type IV fimbrial biogenesis protein FimT
VHKLKNINSIRKVTGFTLIELIITLLIGSLLLAWGVPNFREFKVRKEVSLSVNEVIYSFNLARAEAIRYGTNVQVRLTGAEWKDGWQIWTLNADGSDNAQIFDQQALNDISMTQVGGTAGELEFNSIGAMVGGGTVTFQTDYSYGPVPNSQRNIMISPSGSVKAVNP